MDMEIKDLGDFMENQNLKVTKATITFELEVGENIPPVVEPPIEPPVEPPIEPPVIEPPIEPPVEPPIEPPVEPPTSEDTVVLFSQDFEDSPLKTYNMTDARRDFGDVKYSNGLGWKDLYNVKTETKDGSRVMKVTTRGEHISPDYGFQFHKLLDEFADKQELWFSYNAKFSPYFQPVKGGKLPGLKGGKAEQFGGGNGFSCRWMFKQNCTVDYYIYYPGMDSQYGLHVGRFKDPKNLNETFTFYSKNPVWYNMTQRFRLNDIGEYNGFGEAYIDGIMVQHVPDMQWRTEESVKIEEMAMTHFFGGNTMDWASPRDQNLFIDDVALFEVPEMVGQKLEIGADVRNILPNFTKYGV